MGVGDLDEAEDDLGGDGAAPLVVRPGPEGQAERLGQQRAAVLAVEFLADFPDASGKVGLDLLPVGGAGEAFHGLVHPSAGGRSDAVGLDRVRDAGTAVRGDPRVEGAF